MRKTAIKGEWLLLTTAVVWGFAFVAQRLGGESMGTFAFNSIRFALGGLSLLPLVMWFHPKGSGHWTRSVVRALPSGVLAGTVLFIAASLQQYGIMYTTVGNTAFITGFYIILVPFFGMAIGHRVTVRTWVSAGIAVTGLYLLTVQSGFRINTGDIYQLAGALFWSFHILMIDRFVRRHDALKVAMVQFFTCALLSGIAAVTLERTTWQMVLDTRWPIFYGGLMSVGVAYTLQAIGQRSAKPSSAALILSLETVFGALGAALLLGEVLSLRGYAGAALMFSGTVLSQVNRATKRFRSPKTG